jgi:hypothetical protein
MRTLARQEHDPARARLALPVAVVACAAALLVTAAQASAASPAAYRAHVNAFCRGLTPRFRTFEANITAAQTTRNDTAYHAAVGKLMALSLQEDTGIESVAIPAPIAAKVTRALTLLKKDDVIIRAALALHAKKKETAFLKELGKLAPLGGPANDALDGAGLNDCGSGQG